GEDSHHHARLAAGPCRRPRRHPRSPWVERVRRHGLELGLRVLGERLGLRVLRERLRLRVLRERLLVREGLTKPVAVLQRVGGEPERKVSPCPIPRSPNRPPLIGASPRRPV